MLEFELLDPRKISWAELDRLDDRTIFQTRAWIDFVAETQGAQPVLARLIKNGQTAAYFTGLIIHRLGIRILGSPFPGWTTSYMGFNMFGDTSGAECLAALQTFAFRDLRCMHVEVCDRNVHPEDALGSGYSRYDDISYEMDLTPSEDDILARMSRQCRGNMRKAERCGVQIEEARDIRFAEDYYRQLVEVFGRQNLVPTFNQKRVEKLIEHLLPTGNLLLLRARDPKGKCVATGLWVGMNRLAQFWGNASIRSHQHLRPNEALHWYAIRYWKNRGIKVLMWGGGEYKAKYGAAMSVDSRFSKSRFRMLQALRDGARRMFGWRQQTMAMIRPGRYRSSSAP